LIKADDIVASDWVRPKRQYRRGGYRRRLTCPPYSPKPEEFGRILEGYKWAMLLEFGPRRPNHNCRGPHKAGVELEREAFPKGYYSASGLGCGPCPYCDECNLEKCVRPDLARPSMEACGTEVYTAVRRAGFDLEVVKRHEAHVLRPAACQMSVLRINIKGRID